ncbi:MAG TPA: hypothetical protein VHE37_10815 [Nevskiaceae bacterium]|nr:hypothetical protein [Nevskiaceae bacterium]
MNVKKTVVLTLADEEIVALEYALTTASRIANDRAKNEAWLDGYSPFELVHLVAVWQSLLYSL